MNRNEFIDLWAKEVRTNPNWKSQHTAFINSQILKSNAFYKRLVQTPNGVAKMMRITGCKKSFAEKLLENAEK